jgi:MFS family permease
LLVPACQGSLALLIALRLVDGLAAGPVMAAGPAIVNKWFPAKEKGTIMGLQTLGIVGGIMGSNIVVGMGFAMTGSWATSMQMLTPFALIAIICSIIYLVKGNKVQHVSDEEAQAIDQKSSGTQVFLIVLKQPVFYLGIVIYFISSWVSQAYGDLMPGFMGVDQPMGLGFGVTKAAQLANILTVTGLISSFFIGLVMLKVFKNNYKNVMIFAFLAPAVAIGLIATPFVHNNIMLLSAAMAIEGFTVVFGIAAILTYMSENYPGVVAGKVGGITVGIGMFGASAGTAISSVLLHTTERYTMSMILMVAVCLAACVCSLFMKKLDTSIFGVEKREDIAE